MIDTGTRANEVDQPWPARPWIMAAICATGGFLFHNLVDAVQSGDAGRWPATGATMVAVTTVGFALTVELRRWWWAAIFALLWGAIVGLVGWTSYNYNGRGELIEYGFVAGVFAVLIACPLFQTVRDEGGWRLTSGRVHSHGWTDAVIGAASIAFVGVAFLLAWLIASLFGLIGIDFVEDLLEKGWFGWSLAGFAFGGALGLLRERDALVATMQRLVMVVLGVLAPVLAVALILFLASLPLTGIDGLWDSWVSAAGLTLAAAAGAYLLLNAAIGLGDDDRATNRVLRWSATALALVVLPLAGLAIAALATRIGEYGWTPGRIWAVVCASVALVYGAAGWWAVWRGRGEFAPHIRWAQTRLAIGVCALATLLALPILDFGAISTRDQLSRLRGGDASAATFDWQAMAFDFGPSGRAALARLARTGPVAQRAAAADALAARNRWDVPTVAATPSDLRPLAQRLRIVPASRPAPAGLIAAIDGARTCSRGACVLLWVDDDRVAVLNQPRPREWVNRIMYSRSKAGTWALGDRQMAVPATDNPQNLADARVELGERRQRVIRVDGREIYAIDDGAYLP